MGYLARIAAKCKDLSYTQKRNQVYALHMLRVYMYGFGL